MELVGIDEAAGWLENTGSGRPRHDRTRQLDKKLQQRPDKGSR